MFNRDQKFESGSGVSNDIEEGDFDEQAALEMVRAEEEEFDGVREEISKEENEEIQLRKARRWTTFAFATLAALSCLTGRPQEVQAQEMEMTYIETPVESESDVERLEDLGMIEMTEESRKQLKTLKEAFGDDIGFINWSLYTNINQKLSELHDYVSGKRPAPDNETLRKLREEWRDEDEGRVSEFKNRSIDVEGFNDFDEVNEDSDWNNPEIKELIEERYSEGWLASVKDVAFIPESRIIRMTSSGDTVTFAKLGNSLSVQTRRQIERESPRDSVTIFSLPNHSGMDPDRVKEDYLMPLLDHETAHSNDWENSLVLSPSEKLDFLSESLEHYQKDGRFTNPHLESAEKALEAERQKMAERIPALELGEYSYMAVREYWANLAMAYFQKPDVLKEQHPEEYDFADKWIDRINGK